MELQLWLEEQQALYKTQVHVSRCCICCEDMVAHVHNSVSTEHRVVHMCYQCCICFEDIVAHVHNCVSTEHRGHSPQSLAVTLQVT